MRIKLIKRLNATADEDSHSAAEDEEIQVTDQVQDTMEYARRHDNKNIQELEVFFTFMFLNIIELQS